MFKSPFCDIKTEALWFSNSLPQVNSLILHLMENSDISFAGPKVILFPLRKLHFLLLWFQMVNLIN